MRLTMSSNQQLLLWPEAQACATTVRESLTSYRPFDAVHRAQLPQLRVGGRLFDQLGAGTLMMWFWQDGTYKPTRVENMVWFVSSTTQGTSLCSTVAMAMSQVLQQAGGATLVRYETMAGSNLVHISMYQEAPMDVAAA
jgi:hypothetical protein